MFTEMNGGEYGDTGGADGAPVLGLPNAAEIGDFDDSEIVVGYDRATDLWEVVVKYRGDILRLEDVLGAEIEPLSEQYAIVTLKQDRIAELATYREIEHIELPTALTFVTYAGREAACIPAAQSQARRGLTGRGVIVAVIDSGIDYTHPDFRNEDGSTRILSIWDQAGEGRPPEGFKSGVAYSADQINRALASPNPYQVIPALDTIGHGTAVAGIAAGNGRGSQDLRNQGVAPEASIVAVRLGDRGWRSFARSTELMRAVKYVIDKAEQADMPVAINISYGTNNGPHDGHSLFETYLNDMAQRWKNVIVVASGNEGTAAHHFTGTIRSGEIHHVDFFTTSGLDSFFLTLWKNVADIFSVELVLPSGRSTGEIKAADRAKTVRFGDISVYVYYAPPNHYNVDQNVFLLIDSSHSALPEGFWQLRLRGDQVVSGDYSVWLPITEAVSRDTAFTMPTVETTLTLPATSLDVITVGAYNFLMNSMADFSGRGYTRGHTYIKPDLVAPGVNIVAPKLYGGYDAFTGTSMAAPFVTGAAALMMQWGIADGNDPFLFSQKVKSFLRLGAERKIGLVYPNPSWGFGSLCFVKTMEALETYLEGMSLF